MSSLSARLAALTPLQRTLLARRLAALSTTGVEADRLQLVAYYTLKNSPGIPIGLSERVNDHLRARLPEHMRPQAIVELASFPRLPNGKIDLARLPAPVNETRLPAAAGADAPQYKVGASDVDSPENRLATILGELLGMDDVQADDNFFELGGDSITAIQFVSMAREAGINIGISALTQQATLREIASSRQTAEAEAEPASRTGPAPLTAIQAWFFQQGHPVPERWNLAARQTLAKPLSADVLEQSIRSTIARYPELGQRFFCDGDQWTTQIPPDGPPEDLVSRMTTGADSTELSQRIESIQQSFSLCEGWMFRAIICLSTAGEARDLICVAHHLVIDNLSIQSILREIELECLGALEGAAQLPRPIAGCSLRRWAFEMQRIAQDYGEPGDAIAHALPTLDPINAVTEAECSTIRRFIAHRNPQCIGLANRAYASQTQELVLAGLAIAWQQEMAEHLPIIDVEAHGRDALGDAVDASQSVGWFTTFFPYELSRLEDHPAVVAETKETFRASRLAQRHFLIKRYLARAALSDRMIAQAPKPSLLFNFSTAAIVGQAQAGEGFWFGAALPPLVLRAPGNIRSHSIEVNIQSSVNGLDCQWRFSDQQVGAHLVNRLHEALEAALTGIIDLAEQQSTPAYNPSDFPDVDIDQDDLDSILSGLGD